MPISGREVLVKTATARPFSAKMTSRGLLRGKMLIALMATKTSE